MDYGKKIAEARVGKRLSQEQLAETVHVSRDLVSKWENNRRRPDRQTLLALSGVLDVDFFEESRQVLLAELSDCVLKDSDISADRLPELLNGFLKTVSERDAGIFVRRYRFFETTAEIAQRYKISDVFVRAVLSRTRKKLKRFLERCDK